MLRFSLHGREGGGGWKPPMAASFEKSSHALRWLRESTDGANSEDLEEPFALTRAEVLMVKVCVCVCVCGAFGWPIPTLVCQINYINLLHAVGKQLRLRQTVTATAIVYFWRFYLSRSFSTQRVDPDAMELSTCHPDFIAPTCLSLACKAEECPLPDQAVLHKALEQVAQRQAIHFSLILGSTTSNFMSKILASEFVLLEALQCDIVVFHPYQDVTALLADFAESCSCFTNEQVSECLRVAWDVTNDSYRCDACVRFPPYIIALAVLFIAVTKQGLYHEATKRWWVTLNCDMRRVRHAANYIVTQVYAGPWAQLDVELVRNLSARIYSKMSAKGK